MARSKIVSWGISFVGSSFQESWGNLLVHTAPFSPTLASESFPPTSIWAVVSNACWSWRDRTSNYVFRRNFLSFSNDCKPAFARRPIFLVRLLGCDSESLEPYGTFATTRAQIHITVLLLRLNDVLESSLTWLLSVSVRFATWFSWFLHCGWLDGDFMVLLISVVLGLPATWKGRRWLGNKLSILLNDFSRNGCQ